MFDTNGSFGTNNHILEFEDPIVGSYLGKKHQKRLMYVVRNEDEEDGVAQPFLHSLNRERNKMRNKNNLVDAESEDSKISNTHVAIFPGTEYKDSFKLVISTYYNGKEIAEKYHHIICHPVPIENLTSSKWRFVIGENDIYFKICLEWEEPAGGEFSYGIELFDHDKTLLGNSPYKIHSNKFSYEFQCKENRVDDLHGNMMVKIWTLRRGRESLRSHAPFVANLPPLPLVMKNYARYVRDSVFTNTSKKSSGHVIGNGEGKKMSAYSFRVGLVQQIAGELKNLHEDLQIAATFSREKTVMQRVISEHDMKTNSTNQLRSNLSLRSTKNENEKSSNNHEEIEEQFINDLNEAT